MAERHGVTKQVDPDLIFVPVVAFVPFRCPTCGRHKPRTYSVRAFPGLRTVRYHKCLACGQKYRSFEFCAEEITTPPPSQKPMRRP
jgi:hypothetical protein